MMKPAIIKSILLVVISLTGVTHINSQPVPEDYKRGTISEQLDQLEAHTRIYENYRAIREDIFQTVDQNIKDTLKSSKKRVNNLVSEIAALNIRIDSIDKKLESTKSSLEEMVRTKNNITVLGMEVNKAAYNTLMWSIICIFLLLLIIGYMIFKINSNTLFKQKKELTDIQKEFEEYKQKKRIENENLIMSHFNEIKKLKGESPNR